MMKDMMKSFKDFDDFLKTQIIIVGLISFVWALIIPLITKLQGMLWTTSIISAYLIAQKASAFIYPYFKDMKINKCYKSLIILDILYAISLTIYFVNINVFVYVEALLTLVYGIIISVFTINYNTYVMKTYNANTFKELQYIEKISISIAGILGFVLVIVLDYIFEDSNKTVSFFILVSSIVVIVQLFNYNKFWKNIKEI